MRRAVGIVRVSQRGGRDDERLVSPDDQRGRIENTCEREKLKLGAVHEEIDISGGKPISERDGLRAAIEQIEAGDAEVLIVGYFDRLVRSVKVQQEILSRVGAAGGEVLAVDFGKVSEDTAAAWLSGTMMGAYFEFQRRSAAEKAGEAQRLAVERGIVPYAAVPLGLEKGEDRRLRASADASVVREAFEMRRDGAGLKEVRAFLAERGFALSYRQTQGLLRNRLLIGEIRFGDLVNPKAIDPPVIERDLFDAVQKVRVARGPNTRSDRLLARLGVLRCGTCGGRMSVGTQTQNGRNYPFYRCSPTSDCPKRMAISAAFAEEVVVDAVLTYLADAEGRASASTDARRAAEEAARAQADFDAAIRAFAGIAEEEAAVERLDELRAIRDAAVERAEQLSGLDSTFAVSADDWDDFTVEERRGLIVDIVRAATVAPGKGPGRITVELFSEHPTSDGV